MQSLRFPFFFLTTLLGFATTLSAESAKHDLDFTVFRPDEGPSLVPATRFSLKQKHDFATASDQSYSYFKYDFKTTLATRSDAHDEPTTFDFLLGRHLRFGRPPSASTFDPNEPETDATDEAIDGSSAWGTIDAEIVAAFEADPSFTTQNISGGLRLFYTPELDANVPTYWLPHLKLEYLFLDELRADEAEAVGMSRQSYGRFGAVLYWQISLKSWFGEDSPLHRLTLIPSFQFHDSDDRELAQPGSDLRDSYHYGFTIKYSLKEKEEGFHTYFSAVKLGVTTGRLPTSTENKTQYFLSFVVR